MADDGSAEIFCYFHRDLKVGLAGADVSCLQQYLGKEGHLKTDPTGYFGDATEEALSSWQVANNILPAKGLLGYSSRVIYAKRHKIPTAEQLKAMENQAAASAKRRNIEGYASVGAEEVFYSRKVMYNASREDVMHLCQEACQTATSEACDKTFPADDSGVFRHCLSLVPKNCKLTCEENMS